MAQQQQQRGRTFVTAAVIFHTYTQPGVQLRASVCANKKTKWRSGSLLWVLFFWSLARVALNSLARTYINMYICIYNYIYPPIHPCVSGVWKNGQLYFSYC